MHDAAPDASVITPPTGPLDLFTGFLSVGLLGFGGVLPWARLVVVERRRWMTAGEFTELLAFCQFLPGPNICNLSVALGRQCHGLAGAVAGLAGLMAAPMVVGVGLGAVYGRYGGLPAVAHGFAGLAAAGSGLILATAIKVGMPLWSRAPGRGAGRGIGLALVALTLGAIAVLRLPLLPTMLVLAPLSVWLHWPRA